MASFPERPGIGLLLRLLSQHYQQEMEGALAAGGFEDIGPSAANVFPFVSPEGATISELAELAHVRKQTMAQAVDQLERTGYVERRPNPRDGRSQLIFLTARGRTVPTVTHAAADRVEEHWGDLIGTEELAALKAELAHLLDALRN
jgi:DNA-binding MarR family transcriptional regulator